MTALPPPPALEWDAAAWWRDTRCLSIEARGIWFDLLQLMHHARPRGYLVDQHGNPLSDDFLVKHLGIPALTLHRTVGEIKSKGVCSVDDSGRIYCRRMSREKGGKKPRRDLAKEVQANPPAELVQWIEWWNDLVKRGHLKGYHTASKPPIELCRAWVRIGRMPEVRELLKRKAELAIAIENASFVKRWLTLAGLFGGKNGDGEYKVRKILEGHYADDRKSNSTLSRLNGLARFSQRNGMR